MEWIVPSQSKGAARAEAGGGDLGLHEAVLGGGGENRGALAAVGDAVARPLGLDGEELHEAGHVVVLHEALLGDEERLVPHLLVLLPRGVADEGDDLLHSVKDLRGVGRGLLRFGDDAGGQVGDGDGNGFGVCHGRGSLRGGGGAPFLRRVRKG